MKGFIAAVIISISTLSANSGTGGFDMMQLVPFGLLFVIFYFLLIRPQQKKAKAHQEMLKELHRGDHVVTAGGILGTVDKVSDTEVSLEVANNVKVSVLKSTITEVFKKNSSVTESAKNAPAHKKPTLKASNPVKVKAVSKSKPAMKSVAKKAAKPTTKKQKSKSKK